MFHYRMFLSLLATGMMLSALCAQDRPRAAATTSAATSPASQSATTNPFLERIQAYHAGAAKNGQALRVVYFTPADVDPPKGFQERLTRIMFDVQDFYRVELRRNGYAGYDLPLETDGNLLKIHLVKGKAPSNAYTYNDGSKVQREVAKAVAGEFKLSDSFVLILCNLCDKRPDGSYFMHSPYYGFASNHRSGLCFAADCELLDPLLLTDNKSRIVYKEHLGLFPRTYAEFNTIYLGGLAHELGHGLSLPHDRQSRSETSLLGTALMGSGNYTYRIERWQPGKKGSFLTPSSALRLGIHPLFTQSDRGQDLNPVITVKNLHFTSSGKQLTVEGKVESNVEALALIAYTDPDGGSDYDATTWVTPVKDGVFQCVVEEHRAGPHEMRLVFCHINGATSMPVRLHYQIDASRNPNASDLNGTWALRRAEHEYIVGNTAKAVELAKAALDEKFEAAAPKFRHLIELAQEPKDKKYPEPAASDGNSASLSDAAWTAALVGYGRTARNHFYFDQYNQNSLFLTLGGVFHPKGLYAHTPSRYVYSLKKGWKTFQAIAGLQEGVASNGSAVFIVKGDGKVLYKSPLLKEAKTDSISVNVEGIDVLELLTESGKEDNACCWAVWGSPTLRR